MDDKKAFYENTHSPLPGRHGVGTYGPQSGTAGTRRRGGRSRRGGAARDVCDGVQAAARRGGRTAGRAGGHDDAPLGRDL